MGLSKERGIYFQEKWEEMEYKFANIEMNKEIERLNNIINELEKWLLWRYENGSESISFRESFLFVIDKIKELKGDSSNDKSNN